jgi:hypothetical protein
MCLDLFADHAHYHDHAHMRVPIPQGTPSGCSAIITIHDNNIYGSTHQQTELIQHSISVCRSSCKTSEDMISTGVPTFQFSLALQYMYYRMLSMRVLVDWVSLWRLDACLFPVLCVMHNPTVSTRLTSLKRAVPSAVMLSNPILSHCSTF